MAAPPPAAEPPPTRRLLAEPPATASEPATVASGACAPAVAEVRVDVPAAPAVRRTGSACGSASYQLASTTTGTSTAMRAMSTSAMPSAPTAYCTPKAGIQS